MATKCRSCGGVYQPMQLDGSSYAHVCPRVRHVRVLRDGKTQLVPLAELQPSDVVTVLRNLQRVQTSVALMEELDVRFGDVDRPRPNARNENPDPAKVARARPDDARESLIVAPGLGVDAVPDPAPRDEIDGV